MIGSNMRQLGRSSAIYIAIGLLLIVLMTIIGASAFLRIMDIKVEGVAIYTAEEVIESSGISTGDNLLFVNARNSSRILLAAMPFISEVKITRVPPDTVLIEVTESDAIATIAYAGETLIIDSAGRVLKKGDTKPEGLIEVRGVALDDVAVGSPLRSELGAEMRLQYMQDVLIALEREGLQADVSYLDVSNITNIHFGYLDMYRVILGGPSNVRHKLGQLPGALARLEIRYPGTPGDINMSDPSGDVGFFPNQ
jgi:hypothetical protein